MCVKLDSCGNELKSCAVELKICEPNLIPVTIFATTVHCIGQTDAD